MTVEEPGPLKALADLEELYIIQASVPNVEFLSSLKKLKVLSLARTPISDLSPIAGTTQLIVVDLTFTKITNIVPHCILCTVLWTSTPTIF